jgi:hypothetical protein
MLTLLKSGKWFGLIGAILLVSLFVLDLALNPKDSDAWVILALACGLGLLYFRMKRAITRISR